MERQYRNGKSQRTQLLQGLIESGLRVFEIEDVKAIVHKLNLNTANVSRLISRLIKEGWLESIKKGVYKLTPSTGISPIHEFEIAMHLVKPAMISFYSAFYQHGLTEQLPRIVYISTLKESSAPQKGLFKKKAGFNFHGIEYQIIQVKKDKFYGGEKAWRGESHFIVGDLERTLLEGFAMPQYCGGFPEVMYGLEQSLEKLNLERLVSYAKRWDIAVCRRVGWALEQLGVENEQTLSLAQIESSGYRRLDPSREPKGKYSSKWRLQINL